MGLTRYDPLAGLDAFRESVDSLFDEFFGGRRQGRRRSQEQAIQVTWMPPADIYEEDDRAVVRVELPDIDPNSVDVAIDQDVLTVRARSRHESEQPGRTYYLRELATGQFVRTLRLPFEAQADQARATYANGILEIRVPMAEQARPKRVPVEVQAGQPLPAQAGQKQETAQKQEPARQR